MLRDQDLRIDIITSGSLDCGRKVMLTHMPTGWVVFCYQCASFFKCKQHLLEELEKKVVGPQAQGTGI